MTNVNIITILGLAHLRPENTQHPDQFTHLQQDLLGSQSKLV